MAFDHDDTDVLYDKSIRPVLRRNRVIPIIINRSESTDDLNNQIIESLGVADFCVADLTYTRPSVYFEAGYAQRSVPVIYTARADHLRRNQPDELRVHFDLQMKPIIRWQNPDDAQFRDRLERRLQHAILRDWNRSQDKAAQHSVHRASFASMSLAQRLTAMRRSAILSLRSAGFRRWRVRDSSPGVNYPDAAEASQLIVSTARKTKQLRIATILAQESITATTLRNLRNSLFWIANFPHHLDDTFEPNEVRIQSICMSLRPIPAARVESAFRDYSRGDREGRFTRSVRIDMPRQRDRPRRVPATSILDCVGEVRSERELSGELRSLVSASFSL
jgi:hypothetical protein